MDDCNLRNYLTTNADINFSQLEECLAYQQIKEFKKGDFLLSEGHVGRYVFFVEKGLLRLYQVDDKGKEHLLQFAPEGWFIADHDSMYYRKPTVYFIQALEDCRVHQLNDDFFEQLTMKDASFNQLNMRLLHNHISHLQRRIIQLISYTAEERYLSFIDMYPDLLMRVPQTMIASYLGITPESLSRIRKDLAQKNFYQR